MSTCLRMRTTMESVERRISPNLQFRVFFHWATPDAWFRQTRHLRVVLLLSFVHMND